MNIKATLKEYSRVLRLMKKPSMDEFKTIVKVSALGMGIIGLLGFVISIANQIMFSG